MPTFQATIPEAVAELFMADRIRVVNSHPATTPIEADLITSTAGASPGIASVVSLTPNSIRVTFSKSAVDNAALVNPDNYVITPTLGVYVVTPEAVANPGYVDLTIDEQKTGVAYQVELQRIEAIQ